MIIGLCGGGFAEVRRALQVALPDAVFFDIPGELQDQTVDVLAPLGGIIDAALMDATRPRMIQQFGVGLQGVDIAAARERGIPVAFLPGGETGNAVAVSEIALLHLLALLRRFDDARRAVDLAQVGQPYGHTLATRTVTVLGAGAIGAEVTRRLLAFGATPLVVSRRTLDAYPSMAALIDEAHYATTDGLVESLTRSGALVVCCPLTEDTRGLVGRRQLDALGPEGIVVNVGRGPVVDYDSLLEALRSGRLAGAGLDVAWSEPIDPADPLLRMNVTVTPHIGGVTHESYASMATAFAANVRRMASGQPVQHRAA
ncbi:hypothetical protein K6U06_16660 [Acidiferrimicrobium sp. IK]|uniref:NAD(P)-dependent oxidoreductase n=1 Tax=Acidiferrimicrobium sp. IK TaxID=2871700 RepID=UPI0021CB596D|nr:NAD(P)-dependent oxidoreductase [Acidiferrimicrobium sp. IK]MCU4186003.1 hypothetical protein [Acidiferrimicrobium sp. IK]